MVTTKEDKQCHNTSSAALGSTVQHGAPCCWSSWALLVLVTLETAFLTAHFRVRAEALQLLCAVAHADLPPATAA